MNKRLVLFFLATVGLVTLSNGCATPPPNVERTPSYTLSDLYVTKLGELVSKQSTRHPDKSGVVLLDSGRQAFARY